MRIRNSYKTADSYALIAYHIFRCVRSVHCRYASGPAR